MNRVFVYGTLKQGDLIRGMDLFDKEKTNYVGKAVTTDSNYSMIDLGAFPGVLINGEMNVTGEIYDVDDETLQHLDAIEGYPDFYQRATVNTTEGKAYMYHLSPEYAQDYPDHKNSSRITVTANNLTWN